ncbi:hypothetical protein TcasGA2_TC010494 [Tribolium castaneum]|uniref:Uncharacterized protein n=1 Tax=Tribolium castaneum TaxID=7070 RepID=D6WE68_TRICA|nr:hypothetical protein TcasGA2_TC010494 [Tribolium castaneum]
MLYVSGIINKDSEVNNEDLNENEQSAKRNIKKTVKVEPETDHFVSSEKVKNEIDSPVKHKKKKNADG